MSDDIGSDDGRRERRSLLSEIGGAPWFGLIIGCVFLPCSYGVDNVPVAAWLAPVFLLRFAREQRWAVWVPVLFIVESAAGAFQFRGMTLSSGIGFWITVALGGAVALVPFAVDRAVVARAGWPTRILVFPLSWTVLDYANSFGPYGSWGATAYSQYGELPLLQIVSVTGLWGITFLIGWFATVCNGLLEDGWVSRRARGAACLFGIAIAAILFAGGIRLAAFPPMAQTVRVASLSANDLPSRPKWPVWQRLVAGNSTVEDLGEIHNWADLLDKDLLERTGKAAKSGARVIFWGEGNAQVLKGDEPTLLGEGSQLAIKDHIYLGMGVAVWTPGQTRPLENRFIMIEPTGQIAWQYEKAHPVPGAEAALTVRSDGRLRVINTPYGRLSAAICFDADFPRTIAQVSDLGTDILLNPSNDWRGIDPWHAEMASFRALEQGVSVIHQASHGLSAAYDYEGNRLAAVDYFRSHGAAMVTYVPIRGVRTIYSRFGDWFAWLSVAGLLAFMAIALRSRH
ncbi:MAG: nitrilase-related carbon-nitrogen hydrolase [Steroidobacteraceae bacterium]